jgi:DMSO/TMAO reductase YedYZ heme-binding membrane subunit
VRIMASDKEVRKYLKDHRRPAAWIVGVLAACMLAVPPIVITMSPGGWSSWVSSLTRVTGLYAFTFIFMNIISGALSPYFYAVFKPRPEYLIHVATGAMGFLLAMAHGLIVITQRYYRGFGAVWVIGPVALVLLALTVWVALDRVRLKSIWRRIHQLNYLIFVAVYVKAVLIGTDFKTAGRTSQTVMVLCSFYVGLAAVALALRFRRSRVQAGRVKAPAVETPATESGKPVPDD